MKSRIPIFLITSCLSLTVAVAQTANNPQGNGAEAVEATRLAEQVVELFAHGKYEEALKPAKACLKIRENYPVPAMYSYESP